MKLRSLLLVVAPLALLALRSGSADAQHGRLDGTVRDSVRGRPMAGAAVFLWRRSPEPPLYLSVFSDDRGRFRFDSLDAGRYTVSFESATLDSLDLTLAGRDLEIAIGEHQRIELGSPSAATLRSAACPGVALAAGQGAIVGTVTDADRELPLAGAVVVVGWTDITLDARRKRPTTQRRAGQVVTDSLGSYRLCGVPTGTVLALQVQQSNRVGSASEATVDDTLTILRRSLSFSARSSFALDPAGDTVAAPLTGSAVITGIATGPGGQPLADVQVSVLDAASTARTDSLGRFRLDGLPAGTQRLEARRIGYFVARQSVELRSDRAVTSRVQLTRIVSLDSIRVVARRSRYREFERNRTNRNGRFFDEQQLAARTASYTSELFRAIPGLSVQGLGYDAKIISGRGRTSFNSLCNTNIVIDGFPNQEINFVNPADIGAIEVYSGPAGAPPQYDSACGVVVIWTKR